MSRRLTTALRYDAYLDVTHPSWQKVWDPRRGGNDMVVKPIPDGYHAITPYLVVSGVARLIAFLQQAFDATVVHPPLTHPDGTIMARTDQFCSDRRAGIRDPSGNTHQRCDGRGNRAARGRAGGECLNVRSASAAPTTARAIHAGIE